MDLYAYPNPANSQLSILFNEIWEFPIAIELKNILGETIYSDKIENKEYKINCSRFPNGIYAISMQTQQGTASQKLIIQK